MAGDNYYPEGGTENWIKTFESEKDAELAVSSIPSTGCKTVYEIEGREYDWYEIINLKDWIER